MRTVFILENDYGNLDIKRDDDWGGGSVIKGGESPSGVS